MLDFFPASAGFPELHSTLVKALRGVKPPEGDGDVTARACQPSEEKARFHIKQGAFCHAL